MRVWAGRTGEEERDGVEKPAPTDGLVEQGDEPVGLTGLKVSVVRGGVRPRPERRFIGSSSDSAGRGRWQLY